jgi:hypothetical protein
MTPFLQILSFSAAGRYSAVFRGLDFTGICEVTCCVDDQNGLCVVNCDPNLLETFSFESIDGYRAVLRSIIAFHSASGITGSREANENAREHEMAMNLVLSKIECSDSGVYRTRLINTVNNSVVETTCYVDETSGILSVRPEPDVLSQEPSATVVGLRKIVDAVLAFHRAATDLPLSSGL